MKSISRRHTLALMTTAGATSLALVNGLLPGSLRPANAQRAPAPISQKDPAALLADSALEDRFLGSEDAPVTIIEYASLTCPHCKSFHTGTWPGIKEKYVDTGKVRFVIRNFPFDPLATAGAMLALCAPGDNYYPMMDILYDQQEKWSRSPNPAEALLQISKLAGFTEESFNECLSNQALLNDVNAVKDKAISDFGVQSTPTFYINGSQYSGAMSVEEMSSIIDALL